MNIQCQERVNANNYTIQHYNTKTIQYYISTTWLEMIPIFSSTSYDCHKYLTNERSERVWWDKDYRNVCWKEPGVISKPSGGIFLTPFPILKMIYLQNIRIQVKT